MNQLSEAKTAWPDLSQYVLCKLVPNDDGKVDKIPIDINGKKTDPHNPNNWYSKDEALALAEMFKCNVGFVFTEGDDYFFIDIDHAFSDNNWSPIAKQLCQEFNGCYVEISQSGTGLHIIGRGRAPEHSCRNSEHHIEFYTEKRFVLLTGAGAVGFSETELGSKLPWLISTYFIPSDSAQLLDWCDSPVPEWNGPEGDDDLMSLMRDARGSAAHNFGQKAGVKELIEADEEALARNYKPENKKDPFNRSGADMALACHLAFWTGKNHERIYKLMHRTALFRSKWITNKDYIKNTIKKAVNQCTGVYGRQESSDGSEQSVESEPEPLEPLPDQTQPVMPFDAEMLPDGPLVRFVVDVAERMQCPPDYIAVALMTALGAAIGRRYQVQPKESDTGWLVVPNLWGLIIGRPSQLKTPAVEAALDPLKKIEARENEKFIDEVKRYQLVNEFRSIKMQSVEKNIRLLLKEDKMSEAESLHRQRVVEAEESNSEPVRSRFIVNDSTVEKLGELLRDNPNGLLLYRDEMSGFLRTINDEKRPNDRAFYLEGFNGTGSYRYDRIGRGTIDIEHMVLSVLGSIQPGTYYEYINQALRQGTGDDGLAQRFQLAVNPDEPRHWKNIDREPDEVARQGVFKLFETIVAQQVGVDNRIYRFTPEAQLLFDQWRHELENQKLRCADDHPALISHLAKYRSLIPSLALVIHICASQEKDIAGQIDESAVAKAIRWGEYLESHARRIYHAASSDNVRAAKLILSKINQGKIRSGFKSREIYRNRWAGLTEPAEVKKGLDMLTDYGYLEVETLRTGGRPTSQYLINTSVYVADKGGQ